MKRLEAEGVGVGYGGAKKTLYVGGRITSGLASTVGRYVEVEISPASVAALVNLVLEHAPEEFAAAVRRSYPDKTWLQPAEQGRRTVLHNLADAIAPPFVTKTGKVLTDADIEALAGEAEKGYDISQIKERRGPQA